MANYNRVLIKHQKNLSISELHVPAHVAFLESNLFYSKGAQILFVDQKAKISGIKMFD